MKKTYKLYLMLIILSVGIYSCVPLYPYGYGGQGYRGQGYRDHGYRGQGDGHKRHHDGYRGQGEWSYNSPHE
jgi:hypothetical protein